ncbi:hypothetical protein GGS23DRAFT_573750 [Durotheca rogersii]|uniref:uncharacterized protein n=1 Tax=Durotheca rogersii TaxID=419775 RepID=UPI00221EE62E|nr:uncharacterized protein GGS23DRAFT_573750 [Durotheca rogersii]KAI5861910.1 hypothetical protein GGS23DRAFT_573750 [Durotheca rogersii]
MVEVLRPYSVPIDARERCYGLTALHLAVRNQKIRLIPVLLGLGADPCIFVHDQLDLLAEGRSGCLKVSSSRLRRLTEDVTILGEVLLQCNQDEFYPLPFVEELLRLFLTHGKDNTSVTGASQLYIDSARTTSILHIMAMIPFPEPLCIFQQAQSCLFDTSIDLCDLHGDTPLHYACMSRRPRNVAALIEMGANPSLSNTVGLDAVSAMIFSSIVLGPFICGFQRTSHGEADRSTKDTLDRERQSARELYHQKQYNKRFTSRKGGEREAMVDILKLLKSHGREVDSNFRKLALAWCSLGDDNEELYLRTVPLEPHPEERSRPPQADPEREAGLHLRNHVRSACKKEQNSIDATPGINLVDIPTKLSRQYIMHRAESESFMICHHTGYRETTTLTDDFFGSRRRIELSNMLIGGRPFFVTYG